MNSFYGGPNGAPFKISKIFDSVYYINGDYLQRDNLRENSFNKLKQSGSLYILQNNEYIPVGSNEKFQQDQIYYSKQFKNYRENTLFYDLEKRWQSEIGIDEYVIVMYGLPSNHEPYDSNCAIDAIRGNGNYNGTLWQKIYEENTLEKVNETDASYNGELLNNLIFTSGSRQGWGYKLIGSFAGQTPYFTIKKETVHASVDHKVTLQFPKNDGVSAIDSPILIFNEPKAWQFTNDIKRGELEANESINISIKNILDDETATESNAIPHSRKHLEAKLPKAWNFGFTGKNLEANENPTVQFYGTTELTEQDYNAQNYSLPAKITGAQQAHSFKHLDIKLPKAWTIEGDVSTSLKSNQDPIITFSGIDDQNKEIQNNNSPHSKKLLKIQLPKTRQFNATSTAVSANTNPSVSLINDNPDTNGNFDAQTFSFSLPKPWNFEIGTVTEKLSHERPAVSLSTTKDSIQTLNFALPKPPTFAVRAEQTTDSFSASGEYNNQTGIYTINLKIRDGRDGIDFKLAESLNGTGEQSWQDYWAEISSSNGLLDQQYRDQLTSESVSAPHVVPITYTQAFTDTSDVVVTSLYAFLTLKNNILVWDYSLLTGNSVLLTNDDMDSESIQANKTAYTVQYVNSNLFKLETKLGELDAHFKNSIQDSVDVNNENISNTDIYSVSAINNMITSQKLAETAEKTNFVYSSAWIEANTVLQNNVIQNTTLAPVDTNPISKSYFDAQFTTETSDTINNKIWKVQTTKDYISAQLNTLKNIQFTDTNNDGNIVISFVSSNN